MHIKNFISPRLKELEEEDIPHYDPFHYLRFSPKLYHTIDHSECSVTLKFRCNLPYSVCKICSTIRGILFGYWISFFAEQNRILRDFSAKLERTTTTITVLWIQSQFFRIYAPRYFSIHAYRCKDIFSWPLFNWCTIFGRKWDRIILRRGPIGVDFTVPTRKMIFCQLH